MTTPSIVVPGPGYVRNHLRSGTSLLCLCNVTFAPGWLFSKIPPLQRPASFRFHLRTAPPSVRTFNLSLTLPPTLNWDRQGVLGLTFRPRCQPSLRSAVSIPHGCSLTQQPSSDAPCCLFFCPAPNYHTLYDRLLDIAIELSWRARPQLVQQDGNHLRLEDWG